MGFTIVSKARIFSVKDALGHVGYYYGIPPKPKFKHEIVDGINPQSQKPELMVIRREGKEISVVLLSDENGQPLTGLPMSRRR